MCVCGHFISHILYIGHIYEKVKLLIMKVKNYFANLFTSQEY